MASNSTLSKQKIENAKRWKTSNMQTYINQY